MNHDDVYKRAADRIWGDEIGGYHVAYVKHLESVREQAEAVLATVPQLFGMTAQMPGYGQAVLAIEALRAGVEKR